MDIDLSQDEALFDYRDYCIFVRIVKGIAKRQTAHKCLDLLYESQDCIANIHRTRLEPPEESHSLMTRHEFLLNKLENPLPLASHEILAESPSFVKDAQPPEQDEDNIFVIDL